MSGRNVSFINMNYLNVNGHKSFGCQGNLESSHQSIYNIFHS
jgi:hypothetical protein